MRKLLVLPLIAGVVALSSCSAFSISVDGGKDISADYVEKGDYLRLSRASISYNIPVKDIKWIRNLGVSITGTNLFTVSKYSGVNPDVNVFGTEGNQFWGIDYGALPVVRTILLGIKAEF